MSTNYLFSIHMEHMCWENVGYNFLAGWFGRMHPERNLNILKALCLGRGLGRKGCWRSWERSPTPQPSQWAQCDSEPLAPRQAPLLTSNAWNYQEAMKCEQSLQTLIIAHRCCPESKGTKTVLKWAAGWEKRGDTKTQRASESKRPLRPLDREPARPHRPWTEATATTEPSCSISALLAIA